MFLRAGCGRRARERAKLEAEQITLLVVGALLAAAIVIAAMILSKDL